MKVNGKDDIPYHQPDEKHMYSSSKQIAHSPPK